MSQKHPSSKSVDFFDLAKQLWAPIAGFIGGVILIGKFIELWKGDQTTYTWATAISGFLVLLLALIWVGFSQSDRPNRLILPNEHKIFQPRYPSLFRFARFSLLLLVFLSLGAGFLLFQQTHNLKHKVVVLVTNFEGPDPQNYRVTEIIWENLVSALQGYDDVQLILLENTSIKSIEEAKLVGDKYDATIVIRGWYAVTNESVRVAAHFDILRQPEIVPPSFRNNEGIKSYGIGEIQNFIVQDQLSEEMTYLSLTTVGLVRYSLKDWDGAITSFDSSLAYTGNQDSIQKVQYYIDQAYKAKVSSSPKIEILVASENIPQGGKITEGLLTTIAVPGDQVTAVEYTVERKAELLNDKVAKFPLDQGVVITSSMVTDSSQAVTIAGPQWAALIPPGMIAISIPTCPLPTGTATLSISGTPAAVYCPTPTP